MLFRMLSNQHISKNGKFEKLCKRICDIKDFANYSIAISNQAILQIKQELKRKNVSFIESHTCFITDCNRCNLKKKGSKLYINKITGFFLCTCSRMGTFDVFSYYFLNEKCSKISEDEFDKKNNLSNNIDIKWNQMKSCNQDIARMPEELFNSLVQKFNLPKLKQKDMIQLGCFYEEISSKVYFPLIALNKYIVGYKSISLITLEEETIPDYNSSGIIIYNQKNSRSDNTAIMVSRIYDLLVLIPQQSGNTIICLPYHKEHLPQQLLPSLENFNKLILWFGNDDPSWDMAKHFAKKLNEERCYFIHPTANQPRPTVAAAKGYDLNKIIKNAQPVCHKFITTFQHLRQDVFSELYNFEKVQGIKWQRYPTLNKILKGHRKGEFTVLTGPTGCGKTTFISDYSLDLAMQGVNTLWGSFEIRNVRLAKTMLQQMAETNLDENLEKFNTYADAFEKLPIYFMTFHGQQSIKVVMEAVEHATYVHDISHVIIDNIQFMMGMQDEAKHIDRFWKQDSIVSAFRMFATKHNCHVTLVIHPRKERDETELTTSSIFGSAKATQEADNVLIIQDKRLSSLNGKKYLQIAKNRYSGDLGIMMLNFNKDSLSYAEKKKIKSEKSTN
ncbi:mitochondrial DNA helicase [Prorops nasuta]|uniref:mitochondrial DNA helicase n=1 Tax=Prorops nasuta TaxID=863751 RepID=UPI0034CDF14B